MVQKTQTAADLDRLARGRISQRNWNTRDTLQGYVDLLRRETERSLLTLYALTQREASPDQALQVLRCSIAKVDGYADIVDEAAGG